MKHFDRVGLTTRYRYVITDHCLPCITSQSVPDLDIVRLEL